MFTNPKITVAAAAVALLVLASPALAGPPLICFPFDTGKADLLPWGPATSTNWNNPSPSYDTSRLVADTMRLLAPGAPVLARMENMRRATIYAMGNPEAAERLLQAVINRALAPSSPREASAWFDAGYLVETFKQARPIREMSRGTKASWAAVDATLASIDGYTFVTKGFAITPPTAEVEFAASLMTTGSVSAAHRAKALRGAEKDSLLAKNLEGR